MRSIGNIDLFKPYFYCNYGIGCGEEACGNRFNELTCSVYKMYAPDPASYFMIPYVRPDDILAACPRCAYFKCRNQAGEEHGCRGCGSIR